MPSFNDFTFDDEPLNWDVTPEEQQEYFFPLFDDFPDPASDEQDDGSHQDQPGAGDTFQGSDVTVFNEQEKLTDEETAEANPDPQTLGAQDDPESQEDSGDEAAGDDEDDNSDPAQVDSSGDIYEFLYKGKYPEQGQDSDELTVKEPESIPPSAAAEPEEEPDEVVEVFKEDIQKYLLDVLDSYSGNGLEITDTDEAGIEIIDIDPYENDQSFEDMFLDSVASAFNKTNDIGKLVDRQISKDYWGKALKTVDEAFMFGEEEEDLEEEEFSTVPSFLIDFVDLPEGIDINSFLNAFAYLNEDLV